MERKNDRVSVCMTTYNCEKYIAEQLDSILTQLGPQDEVIVSDDGSVDRTLDIILSFNDDRIKLLRHRKGDNPYNGPSRNIYFVYRNVEYALGQATGDYIFLSDQDDIWLPGKVETVKKTLWNGKKLVMHDSIVTDSKGVPVMSSYFSFVRPRLDFIKILSRCFYQGASMAFTREVLERSLPFPDNTVSHDHWIAYNVHFGGGGRGKVELIREPLMLYRRHTGTVSPSAGKSPNPLSFKLMYRIRLVRAMLNAYRR